MSKNKLAVIYGSSPREMTKRLLDEINPPINIEKTALIGLKPNLVLAKPASSGATTSPEVVRGVIEHLHERGFSNMVILESSWLGGDTERAFTVCNYREIMSDYKIPLVNLKKERTKKISCQNLTVEICQKALEVDYLINIPVLKAHCQTKLTCALKNLKGCIPDREKRRFHSLGLHEPIAVLNKIIKTSLVVVDAMMGDLTFEEGGNPVEMGRIIIGNDPVLVDSYAANLIGYEIGDIPYISIAEKIGVGNTYDKNTLIHEIDKDKMPGKKIRASSKVSYLARWIEEKEACSPCYGSLIHALCRLEESGDLRKIKKKICIGRGFRDIEKNGFGIGLCTKGFSHTLTGCPPEAAEIVAFLRR